MKNKNKIAIVDIDMGNLWSLKTALNYIGLEVEFISNSERLNDFNHVILPGVGSFKKAVNQLKKFKFDKLIRLFLNNIENKLLCICLGMQILGHSSTEDGLNFGLNFVKNKVVKIKSNKLKNIRVPHIGFNNVKSINNFLIDKKTHEADFYFNHSYKMNLDNLDLFESYSTCNHRSLFLAGFKIKNITATQFHPEKSQKNGIKFLKKYFEK